ncbi:ESPR-type extended signal peptide-containing protein [uncultured Dialister sp.]|uniref:ESPR-type extended signal peptide-containing protein n=1 Tax=uncultured Dialister sp. TaxID=278064 RepID=UPI002657B820|nr:ESPR-type extended signal peptide-containing protein [uncultured Dialister sp.]
MNKIFKIIFSKARGCYVVVSELAKSSGSGTPAPKIRREYGRTLTAAVMAALMGMAFVGAADITTVHDYSVNSVKTDTDTNYNYDADTGSNALAAGVSAKATGENAVAIGYGAKADGYGATVIGQYGTAMGRYALAFGGQQTDTTAEQANNVASGDNAVSFGERTTASGANATSFGWQTTAKEKRATAFGERTTASGANSTAFGQLATASGQNSTAFGNEARANNYGSTAFGNRTEALGEYSTAFGNSTVAAGMNTVAFGTDNVAGAVLDDNGAYTNIIYKTNAKGRVVKDENGNPIELSREKMDARGNLAYTDGSSHTKSVTYTVPGGETHNYVLLQGDDGNTYIRDYRGDIRSATIGTDGKVTVGDTALTNVTLKKANAGANGYHILSNANATVWGENSIASGEASTAFGVSSIAAAKNSLAALGGTVAASATNAAAIGSGAKATLSDSVALGSHSVTTRAKYKDLTSDAEKAAYAKGASTGSAWEATDNAIAVGNDSTVTRQITGVAAGSLDTDAVNVAQLKAVDARHTTVSVGGKNATADNTVVNGGNLEMTRTTSNGQANYDVSLNKDIVLGQQEENKGGSITVNSVGTFRNYDNQGNYTDYPMKEAVKIDGTTISVVKHDGSDGDNDQRQVVMGVGQDTGGYVALYDNTGKKPTYIFNAISPGITYLNDANEFGRLEYGDIYNGSTQFIATLDDGLKFSGDQGSLSTVKLNQELSVTGGADTNNLSDNNIGVVSTPAVEDRQGNITQKAKLELKLNKDLTGLNTVTAGTAKIGSYPADTLKLTENGAVTEKTAPAGSYVTGLDNKDWSTTNPSYVSGRAATEDQLAAVSGTINKGLSFTTNTQDAANTTDNYKGYKVVNRKLGDTIAIKAGDADPLHHYATTNLTTEIANNGDITIKMDESPTFTEVTASSFNLSPKDTTTKDKAGNTASAQLNAHYRDGSLNPDKNVKMADDSTGMVRLHYHDGEGTIHDLATMDDGQIYAGDIKKDGTLDTTGFGRKMNEKTTINGGVTNKDNLTDNNIGVVSNGTDTLTVKLAKELKDLTSVTTGKTVLNNGGITITNDVHDPNKTVAVKGDEVTFGGNQVTNMGSGADGTADGKPDGTPTYNTLTNGANIGDVKNIAGSTTDAAKLTGDSNITVTYNDSTADGKNTVKLNDSITLGSDADKKVTIDGTAGTITAGGKVSLDGSTGTGSIGGVTIGNQTGVTTTKMDGDKAKTEDGTFVTGLSNKTWNPDSNGIVSGRAATEDQLKTVSDTVNAGWELDVNGGKRKDVTPTSRKVNFKQGQNISISGSGDDVTVATADDVRFTTIHVTGDKNDSGSYTGGITIGKQSGGDSANPGPGYYITGLENKSWNANQIQSGRAATEDQLKQVAEDIKHGTVDGDKYVTDGNATYEDNGQGSVKLNGTNGLEGTISNLHDYYVTKGEVSDDGKTLTMKKNDGSTFNVSLDKVMQSDMRLVRNPAREDGKYIVDSDGNLTLTVQDANGTEATKQTITLSGLSSKAEVDKGLTFAANSGTPYNAKLGNTVTVKGSAVKAGHDYSDENLTTEVDGNGNITIKMDKDLTANTMTVSGKDGKDGQIGITGKDGADGTVTTIIKTIGRNGTNGTDGTPSVNGTDGITRIVYQDGKDGDAGTTTHTVATLDDGLKFGANAPVVGKTVNPVGNKMNSTIKITGDGDKELDKYSGKNLLTSVEQDGDGNTTIHVLMDKNISADSMVVGQAGKNGKDGYIGINGKDGADGITTTLIRTEKGQPGENGATGKPGVDGKDITRIVYQNDQDKVDGKNGSHTVATLDDGLKFSGDDNKVITKKLNEQLQFVGGADKDKLTQNNIGINELEDGKLTIQLVNTPDLGAKGNLKAGDAHIGWFDGDTLNMTRDGTNPSGNKAGAGSYATGLSNTDWNVTNPEYVSGRAATEDQLAKVSKAIGNATTAAGKRTVVTVNDKSNPAKATPNAMVGVYGDYDSTGGNLMIAAMKDSEGVLTYNIKLNDQLAIGQKGEPGVAGKDGKDGKVTVETKGGTTVVIGHDGKDGDNGRDGLFVTGKDGANGVSITGPDGAAGTDGKVGIAGTDGKVGIAGTDGKDAVSISGHNGEGHIGLTGPKGADGTPGKDGISIDITTDLKAPTLDSTKNVSTTVKDSSGKETIIEQAPRIQYKSGDNTYEVATMDDGLKFVGNDDQEVTRKLNETLSIKGGLDKDAVAKASTKNLGVRKKDDGLEIVMTDTPDFTKVTVGGDNKITIGGQTVTGKKADGSDADKPQTGNYITGLDNKAWDKDNIVENRAATEGQLKAAINDIKGSANGGFGLADGKGGTVKKDLGDTVTVKGDGKNIETTVKDGALEVSLKKDVDLGQNGSIKAGETTINSDGVDTNKVTIKDSSISISKDGINGGSKQITNVASGASEIIKGEGGKDVYKYDNDTNAANIGDVKRIAGDMKTEINNNISNVTNKVDQIGQHVDNIQKDVTQLQQDVKADRTYQGDDGAAKKVKVKFGSFLSLTGGAKLADLTEEGNIGVVQKEIEDPDHKGEKIAGLSVRLAKHLNLEKTTYTSEENGQTYTSEIDGKGLTIKTGDENRNITVQDGNVNMGGNQIHHVAPGQAPDDAVNVSQLNATNYAVNKLDTRVNRVGANAAALAALHPLDFDPDDKWDFSAGYGHYKDANAAAVGAFYRPNEDTMFSVGGSFGGGENMVNAGISVKLGQGNHVSTSRVAMAKEIKDLKKDVAALKAVVNQQSALIDKLTGVNAGELSGSDDLFPDVPSNHWAYEYVTRLKQAGILTGYPDGNFAGDRMMTRYEFAAIVYRAIMAGAAANPSLNKDGTLDRLAKEFSSEMKYIRIDTIRKDRNGRPTIQRVRVIKEDEKEK